MRKSELVGRRGKQPDGSARTREVKLGCVFTQVGLDKEGYPQRDPDSTTYVGAIESSTLFGWRMYAEAVRRGLDQAQTVIVLTDGQRYNHTIVQTHFCDAVHIVDLFSLPVSRGSIDGDRGGGVGDAQGIGVSRDGALAVAIEVVGCVVGSPKVPADAVSAHAGALAVPNSIEEVVKLLAGHGRAILPIAPSGSHLAEGVIAIHRFLLNRAGDQGARPVPVYGGGMHVWLNAP